MIVSTFFGGYCKSVDVKRGAICETIDGSFKFCGRYSSQLYRIREMRYSEKRCSYYPIRGKKGEYLWTAAEVVENFGGCLK